MKLKVFSDRRYLPSGSVATLLLEPLWGKKSQGGSWWFDLPIGTALHRYFEQCGEIFDLTSLEECDVAVLPVNWMEVRGHRWLPRIDVQALRLSRSFAEQVREANKPLIVFFSGDRSHEPVPLRGATVFRSCMYRSRQTPNDFVSPVFVEDFVKHYFDDRIPLRRKGEKPVVGFCGLARQPTLRERATEPLYYALTYPKLGYLDVSPYAGMELREKALRILTASPRVETRFEPHRRAVFLSSQGTVEDKRAARQRFVENMANSDYVLCMRGSGNYSLRLFETLSCGRIPLLVDTNSVQPFDFAIDWKQHCVWVDESDLDRLPDIVADFHDSLSNADFEAMQLRCRDLWLEWLCAESFFRKLHRHFSVAA